MIYMSKDELPKKGDKKVSFQCEKCGNIDSKNLSSLRLNFLCKKCSYKQRAETIKKNNLEKYGVENTAQLESVKAKVKQNNLKKYGCHPSQLDSVKEKQAKTNLEKYGTKSAFQNDEVRQKFKENYKNKHGVENPFQNEEVKTKIKQTNLEKFGVENPMQNKIIKDTSAETCVQKYGLKYCFNFHKKAQYEFDNLKFDSKPELAFYIYMKDKDKVILRNSDSFDYTYGGKEHKFYPDFKIGSEYFEIKGSQFVKPNGQWQNPFDSTLDGLYEAKHQSAIKNNVHIVYEHEYNEYIEYVNSKYSKDYFELFKTDLPFPYLNMNLVNKSDLGLIQHFHKSIYEASKKGKPSPKQAWEDKNLIKKVAANRLKYIGSCRPSDILQGFSVTRLAPKISVFSPKLGENLISEFLNEYEEIVDPFSGFSGRLLASVNLGKKYIGKDINEKHVFESNEIIKFKQIENASVSLEDILTKNDIEEYQCLFTCPPYGGKEHWNENNDEIEKSCDEWIDVCLAKYKCKAYLFVVDETEKYRDNIVEFDLGKKTGLFHKLNEKVVLISR